MISCQRYWLSPIPPSLRRKAFALLIALFATDFSSFADYTLEDISPHFSTNAANRMASTDESVCRKVFGFTKSCRKLFLQRPFPTQSFWLHFRIKGFQNLQQTESSFGLTVPMVKCSRPILQFCRIWDKCPLQLGDRRPDSPGGIATNQAAVDRAWNCLAQLGLDRSQFVKTNDVSSGGYGVFIPRQIDGIQVYGGLEGFQIQFNKQKVLQFCLLLPNLERDQESKVASPQQIIACIRAFKTPSPPNGDEPNYFGRIKGLAKAKKITITKITPYYGEGIYGEAPTNGELPTIVTPIAELEAVANLGNSNATVRLLSPILSTEAIRLLESKTK